FSWLLVHPLALAVDALLLAPSGAIDLLWPNPASMVVLSGWLALLLFVGLFLTTVAPRLRFDWWRRLHRASALAYGCMAWHLIAVWTGSVAAGLALAFVA